MRKAIAFLLIAAAAFAQGRPTPSPFVIGGSSAGGTVTVNGQACVVGSSCTVTAAPSGPAGGGLGGTYPNPTVAGGGISNTIGTVAALPGSGTTTGDMYNVTDGFYRYIWNGAAWTRWVAQYLMVEPVSGSFAWNNQGGASVSTAAGGVVLTAPASGSDDIRSRDLAYPAAPFTLTIKFYLTMHGANFANAGIVLRDSGTGKLVTFGLGTNNGEVIGVNYWNSVTSFSASPLGVNFPGSPVTFTALRLNDDGANRNWYSSLDGGITWVLFLTTTNTDFLTADRLGFFVDSANARAISMSLLYWQVL